MTKKIQCKTIKSERATVKVKSVKSPLTAIQEVRSIILARARAVVL